MGPSYQISPSENDHTKSCSKQDCGLNVGSNVEQSWRGIYSCGTSSNDVRLIGVALTNRNTRKRYGANEKTGDTAE